MGPGVSHDLQPQAALDHNMPPHSFGNADTPRTSNPVRTNPIHNTILAVTRLPRKPRAVCKCVSHKCESKEYKDDRGNWHSGHVVDPRTAAKHSLDNQLLAQNDPNTAKGTQEERRGNSLRLNTAKGTQEERRANLHSNDAYGGNLSAGTSEVNPQQQCIKNAVDSVLEGLTKSLENTHLTKLTSPSDPISPQIYDTFFCLLTPSEWKQPSSYCPPSRIPL
ncbi:hypothetical protein PCANC_07524 [Puccinia coronata f. sp. avenae]|uniref:Uncharacterized protein n=1 Tax=Puccinia coronata f. sp. avenae TaxID=200324 RepID=A0A2N5VSN7_9BASI|nr:hypothetical protein PCANC_07524 [Puccinia coronata f. sp. avenae]